MRFPFFMWIDADESDGMGCSDYNGNQTKLPKILLNGNNICMVSAGPKQRQAEYVLTSPQLIPGGEGPAAAS